MDPNIPPQVVSTIVTAGLYRPKGVTFSEIFDAFPTPPDRPQLGRWVRQLVDAKVLDEYTEFRPTRYITTVYAAPYLPAGTAGATPATAPGPNPVTGDAPHGSSTAVPGTAATPSPNPAASPLPVPAGSSLPASAGSPAPAPTNGALAAVPATAVQPGTPTGTATSTAVGAEPGTPNGTAGGTAAGATAGTLAADAPPPVVTGGTAPTAATPPTGRDDFAALFDAVVADIVVHLMPRASALPFLQQIGAQRVPASQQPAFVAYALDRLSHLTLGECLRHGLQPAQYELWRQQYTPEAQPDQRPGTIDQRLTNSEVERRNAERGSVGNANGTIENRDSKINNSSDPVAQALTPLLEAVLQSAAGSLAPSMSATKSGSAVPASVPPAVPKATVQAAAKALLSSAGRYLPGGMNPLISTLLLALLVPSLAWTVHALLSSGWLTLLVCAAAVAGLYLIGFLRRRTTAAATAGAIAPAAAYDLGARPPSAALNGSDVTAAPPTVARPDGDAVRPRRWRTLAAVTGCLLVIVVAAGALWYRLMIQRPSKAALREYLAKAVAPLPVKVSMPAVSYGTPDGTGCPLTYRALLETTEPLYRRIDTVEYLRAHFPAELTAIESAEALLRKYPQLGAASAADQGPETKDQRLGIPQSAVRTPQSAPAGSSLNSQPSTLNGGAAAPLIVTTQTPPGAAAMASGSVVAWRRDGAWVFTGNGPAIDRTVFSGDAKPPGAYAVDLPADAARLQALVATHAAYAAKVQEAAAALAAELQRERQQRASGFAQLLRPGTLFTGSITDPVRGGTQRVVIEITDTVATAQRLSAVLRNDGGWSDVRPFQGEWTLSPDADLCTLVLRTSRADFVDSAGPLLQDRIDWSWTLQLRPDGTTVAAAGGAATDLKSQISDFKFGAAIPLHRVDPADAPAVRADILRPLAPAIEAVQPGLVYRGTVTSRVYRTTESLVLRFTGGDGGRDLPIPPYSGTQTRPDADLPPSINPAQILVAAPALTTLRATVESTTRPGWVRPFQGAILSNTYRVGTLPIRLKSADADRVAQATDRSLLGFNSTNNSLTLALRADNGRLVGQDEHYTYEFAPAPGANSDLKSQISDFKSDPAGSPLDAQPTTLDAVAVAQATDLEPRIAYARIAGRWVPLPHNNGHEVKKLVQVLSGFLGKVKAATSAAAGKEIAPSNDIVGELVFDGTEPVPQLPGADALIVYVGGITPRSNDEVRAYPLLLLEPVIELSPMLKLPHGERYALFSQLVPGVKNFGPRRVAVEIEQPQPTLTVVRPKAPLTPGPYAVECNGQSFEFVAQ